MRHSLRERLAAACAAMTLISTALAMSHPASAVEEQVAPDSARGQQASCGGVADPRIVDGNDESYASAPEYRDLVCRIEFNKETTPKHLRLYFGSFAYSETPVFRCSSGVGAWRIENSSGQRVASGREPGAEVRALYEGGPTTSLTFFAMASPGDTCTASAVAGLGSLNVFSHEYAGDRSNAPGSMGWNCAPVTQNQPPDDTSLQNAAVDSNYASSIGTHAPGFRAGQHVMTCSGYLPQGVPRFDTFEVHLDRYAGPLAAQADTSCRTGFKGVDFVELQAKGLTAESPQVRVNAESVSGYPNVANFSLRGKLASELFYDRGYSVLTLRVVGCGWSAGLFELEASYAGQPVLLRAGSADVPVEGDTTLQSVDEAGPGWQPGAEPSAAETQEYEAAGRTTAVTDDPNPPPQYAVASPATQASFQESIDSTFGSRVGFVDFRETPVVVGLVNLSSTDQTAIAGLAREHGLAVTAIPTAVAAAELLQVQKILDDRVALDSSYGAAYQGTDVDRRNGLVRLFATEVVDLGFLPPSFQGLVKTVVGDELQGTVANYESFPPGRAGKRIRSNAYASCTSGYVFDRQGGSFASTAGHCAYIDAQYRTRYNNSFTVGNVTLAMFGDADVALVRRAYFDLRAGIFNGGDGESFIRLSGIQPNSGLYPGVYMCSRGARSGTSCGRIQGELGGFPTSFKFSYTDPRTGAGRPGTPARYRVQRNMFCTDASVIPGDSGGPTYAPYAQQLYASGMISGLITRTERYSNGTSRTFPYRSCSVSIQTQLAAAAARLRVVD